MASRPTLSLALACSGAMPSEVITRHGDQPSVHREFLDAGGCGLHHVGLGANDRDAALADCAARGCARALEGTLPGGARVAYVDTTAQLGHFTELWEEHPDLLAWFRLVADAARDWDGRDPIRRV